MAGKVLIFYHGREVPLSLYEICGINPVRAGLVKKPEEWHWSSAGPHMKVQDDILVKTKPLLEMVNKPWEDFLAVDAQEPEIELFSA